MKLKSLLNENASRTAMEIGGLTGMNKDAIQKFVDTHNLDIEKVFQYVKKGKLSDRMDFVTAVVGKPGNPLQKKMIKMFGESVKEAMSVDPRKVYGGTGAKEGMVLVAQKGLDKVLDLSKKNPSNVFLVSDDNYTNFGPFYVKNGKVAKYTVANPNYDFEKNKVRTLKVPSDVILKFKIVEGIESVNELKKLPNGNFSIKKGYNTFADYEKNAKSGDTILKYDKRGSMVKTFVSGNELNQNAKKYLSKVHSIVGDKVNLSLFGKQGIATVPDYEKKEVGVLVLESQDHEVKMSQNSLDSIIKYATELKQKMGEMEKDIPAWIQDHITNAENYISQASSNYHEYGNGMNEGRLNEMDRQLNMKVNKMLSYEFDDLRDGSPNHLWAIMHVLIGALRDANFHTTAKKVPTIFGSKAKYEGDPMAEKDLEKMYEYDLGPNIAALAKWDGKDIVDAIGFYVSMNVGRPTGEKIEKLIEGKK